MVLLISLIGAAYSTTFNLTLGKPKKVENYLAQSRIYDNFVAYVADQAAKSEGDGQIGSVSLSDAAVQSAAKASFPPTLIQNGVNSFLNANYAWLEGKTANPAFKIDLSAQKLTFAKKVGQVVKAYTATLPVCTDAQATKQRGADPLAAVCRPKGVTPAAVGAQVTRQLSTTGDFLSDPVITASSVNPKGNKNDTASGQSQPYYVKLSKLPRAYRAGKKLPYVFGALALVAAVIVFFAALTRRKAWRWLGMALSLAGIILLSSRLIADFAVRQLEKQVFNASTVGPLQRSLTDFAHRVAGALVRIDIWFGAAFLTAGLVILITLWATRRTAPKAPAGVSETPGDPAAGAGGAGHLPLIKVRKRLMRPFGDSIMPLGTRPGGAEETQAPQATAGSGSESTAPKTARPKRKKPRLIQ